MKAGKILGSILLVTVFSLLYVWQQTEIFRLAYIGQKKTSSFHELLDKNSILRYNLNKSTSLICIDDKISGDGEFQVPASYMIVKVNVPREIERGILPSKAESIISGIFSVKRQAQAKTINP